MWSIAAALPAVCTIENAELAVAGRLSQSSHDTWAWQASLGDRVRCDLPGYEPLDASCPATSCSPGPRTLQPSIGRPVEIHGVGQETGAARVEWRRFGLWGEATQPLAVRRLEASAREPLVVFVARGEDRLLRLRREGGAPETFYLPAPEPSPEPPAGSELEPVVLQPLWPAEGGELFGFVEAPDFRPLGLRLEGPETAELGLDAYGMFAHSPLRAGRYRLHALFRGRVELAGPTVRVASGETAELVPWQLPPAGALELELDPELCDGMATSSPLLELEGDGGAGLRLRFEADGCRSRFEGLAPGEWTLTLRGVGEPASAVVALEAGGVTGVTLARPRTWLEGVVRAGEEPLAELELRVSSSARGREPAEGASTYTDSEGRYRLELPSPAFPVPGPVVLELLSPRGFPITRRDLELKKGANVQSFDLGEGRIEVRVERADGGALDEGVTIEVWREGTLVRTGELAQGEEETLIYDLGYGRYELSAFAAGGWVTA
ncbi:MAG: hypothetical protein MI919_28250, partial [Holophagales bacterium]|nr:hypothetical protein [Holophagales bacterium]